MKTNTLFLRIGTAAGAAALLLGTAWTTLADDAAATATAGLPHKSYTGLIRSVDAKEHTLSLKGFVFNKTFNLGDNCSYSMLGKDTATLSDVHPGQKVMVNYQDAHGVLVASRITQLPMREEGMVQAMDPAKHTMTLRMGSFDRTLQVPEDCIVVLRGDKDGTLADIQVGNHVTVTYETPNDRQTAMQIAQTSTTFTGSLTAIDLDARTIKAKALFGTKKFNVADDCAIVMNGKPNGKLSDLKPDQRLVFSYNDINGVNVVDRIAPAGTPQETETTAAQPMTQP